MNSFEGGARSTVEFDAEELGEMADCFSVHGLANKHLDFLTS